MCFNILHQVVALSVMYSRQKFVCYNLSYFPPLTVDLTRDCITHSKLIKDRYITLFLFKPYADYGSADVVQFNKD